MQKTSDILRITRAMIRPIIMAAGIAFIFFSSASPAQNQKTDAEQIICPNMAAADAGSLLDEYYLARAYDKGYCNLAPDHLKAMEWYRKAADSGHMLAQYTLAEIYFSGNGAPIDYPQAKKWYLAAATQGHGLSQLRLAFLYAEAHFKGLTVDYEEAEKWFLKAAEQDAGDARFRLGNFYHNYKRPPEDDKAIHWLTKAAEGGHRVAMFDLARMLKDQKKSLMWMTKAADLGLMPAQMTLSELYATGTGAAPKDTMKSLTWIMKIVASPGAPAFWVNKAADIFFDGWEDVPKNYPQALKLYERNATKGNAHALARMGRIYMEGLGVDPDPARGTEYLRQAAAQGDLEAKKLLPAQDSAKP